MFGPMLLMFGPMLLMFGPMLLIILPPPTLIRSYGVVPRAVDGARGVHSYQRIAS
jgi:hypothetical protein